jgi:putative tricarboxylic transport membrane protein
MFDSINMFIPAGPGGGWDGTGRAIEAACKGAGLVESFQFENVGGAGGMVGLPKFVNQRKGQGNALLVGGSVMVGAGLTNKSPVTMRDVTPIARLTEEAGVIVVPTGGKIQSWGDLAAALKANPKAVSVGGGSAGGTDHQLLGLILKSLGKSPKEAAYVAFAGGGPATAAIIGGQVTAGISGYSEFEAQIAAGKMKAIAVSGNKRIPGVNLPTLIELGVNVTAANWRGVFAAPGITEAERAKLVDLITQMVASAQWKEILNTRKWTDVFLAGKEFQTRITQDIADTEGVLKDLGLV